MAPEKAELLELEALFRSFGTRDALSEAFREPRMQCGNSSTAGLRKLDDGQNESVADVHRRRKKEEQTAMHGKWDSTPFRYDPPKPVLVKDARPQLASAQEGYNPGHEEKVMRALKPKHQAMIESMMEAYRTEAGCLAATTVRDPRSGRMQTVRPSRTSRRMRSERATASSPSSTSSLPKKAGTLSPQEMARRARAAADEAELAKAEAIARTGLTKSRGAIAARA